jgi:hypothetical protein
MAKEQEWRQFSFLNSRPILLLQTILGQQGTEAQFGWICTVETTSALWHRRSSEHR